MEIPAGIRRDLTMILDYIERDEAKDYEAREPKDRPGHIYESVIA